MRIVVLTISLLISLAAVTQAQTPATSVSSKQALCLQDDKCRQHSMNAKDLSKAGKLSDAIEEYEVAYREIQLPVFLYNIGRLHHRLGNHEQAASYYHRFLSASVEDDPEQRKRAEEYLKQIEPSNPAPVSSAPPVVSPPPAAPGALLSPSDSSPRAASTPLYKKWWVWTIPAIVIVGAAAGITAFVLTRPPAVDASGLPTYAPTF